MDVLGPDTSLFELSLVARDLGDPLERRAQALQLKAFKVFSIETFVKGIPNIVFQN